MAENVLSSLEEPDSESVMVAWAKELESRSRDIAEGKVQTIEWGTARQEISEELVERRARQTPS